jgi:amino acid transporter
MKAKNIVFLSVNAILTIVAFGFSFGNVFLEKNDFSYSITEGQKLFDFSPDVCVVFTAIILFCMMALCIAMFVVYYLLKKHKTKKLWKWYLALSIALGGALVAFVIFAVNVCLSKSVFGFGLSTDYTFNIGIYVVIILLAVVCFLNMYNALDTNKKLLK